VIGAILLPNVRSEPFGVFPAQDESQEIRVLDFVVILEMVRATWTSRPVMPSATYPERSSPYDPTRQLDVASRWLGRPAPGSLLFLHTPTILWLFGPIALLTNRIAYVVWTIIGLVAVCWMTAPRRGPLILGPLLLLTPPVLACFTLGQTALFTAALLLYLGGGNDQHTGKADRLVPDVLALWALTVKPQLALAAGAAMLATGRFRAVGLALLVTLGSLLALLPWLGANWVGDYLTLLWSANLDRIHPAFAGTLDVTRMSNLRAVLSVQLGVADALASSVSSGILIATLLSLAIGGRVFRRSRARVWSSAILLLLCFAPHVNAYQQLQLHVVLALCWAGHPVTADPRRLAMAALAFGSLFLNTVAGPVGHLSPSWTFLTNLSLGVLVWVDEPSPSPRGGSPAELIRG
jgi:hypothetical protein